MTHKRTALGFAPIRDFAYWISCNARTSSRSKNSRMVCLGCLVVMLGDSGHISRSPSSTAWYFAPTRLLRKRPFKLSIRYMAASQCTQRPVRPSVPIAGTYSCDSLMAYAALMNGTEIVFCPATREQSPNKSPEPITVGRRSSASRLDVGCSRRASADVEQPGHALGFPTLLFPCGDHRLCLRCGQHTLGLRASLAPHR